MLPDPLGEDVLVVHACGYVAVVRRLTSGPYLRSEQGSSPLSVCPGCGAVIQQGTLEQEWHVQCKSPSGPSNGHG